MDFLQTWGALIISAISLILTAISLPLSIKANKLQNRVNELDAKIKEYELDKIEREKEEGNKFEVKARAYRVGKNWKLKIYNISRRTAYKVQAEIEGGQPFLLRNNMPYDELEPQDSFDASIIYYDNAPTKFRVIITWQDENGNTYNKSQLCSM